VETFQALVSNDHIYRVINIVLVIQRVSVEVRGELSTKPRLVCSTPPFGKNGLTTTLIYTPFCRRQDFDHFRIIENY